MEVMSLVLVLSLLLNFICLAGITVAFKRHDLLMKHVSDMFNHLVDVMRIMQDAANNQNDTQLTTMESLCQLQDTTNELMTHYIEHHRSFHGAEPMSLTQKNQLN